MLLKLGALCWCIKGGRVMIAENGDRPKTSLGCQADMAETLPLTADVCAILDQRLAAFAGDGDRGLLMTHVLADLRRRL